MNTVEKILKRLSGEKTLEVGQFLEVAPDLIILYDWWGVSNKIGTFLDDNKIKIPNKEKVVLFIDHMVPPINSQEANFHQGTRDWARRSGLRLIENEGIGHQVSAELGLAKPGMLIVHVDAHVQVLGAFGAFGLSMGPDLVSAFALGKVWIDVPHTYKIELKGKFPDGVMARDLWLKIVNDIGPSGAIDHAILFTGEGTANVSIDGRMSLCGFPVQAGAVTALFEPDELMLDYLKDQCKILIESSEVKEFKSDADTKFSKSDYYNLAEIEPSVICPPTIDTVKTIRQVEGVQINQGYIGSCANGRIEDLEMAARILKGKKIANNFRLNIVPTSRKIMNRALKEGWMETFSNAGAFISSASCDYCYGRMQCMAPSERAVSTGWLNIPGRMGSIEAEIYLASAATVAATAIEGRLADPRKYL